MKNYTPEQIAAIIEFVGDFVTWVNQEIDKEISTTMEISFAVTPEYRAKLEGKTATYNKCINHLADVAKQLVTDNISEIEKQHGET